MIDRFIIFGIMPEVEEYFVQWPDLGAPGEKETAEIAGKRTEALAKYMAGGMDELFPPEEFLKMIMGMDEDDVKAVIDAGMKFSDGLETKEEETAKKEVAAQKVAADEETSRQIEIEKVKAEAKAANT